MKHLVVIALALAIPSAAIAGLPQHPGQHPSTFASARVCQSAVFKTGTVPNHGNITIAASVAGHEIHVIGGNGSSALDLSGRGVLVRVIQDPTKSAPLTVRVASVRRDCARVNVLATWG